MVPWQLLSFPQRRWDYFICANRQTFSALAELDPAAGPVWGLFALGWLAQMVLPGLLGNQVGRLLSSNFGLSPESINLALDVDRVGNSQLAGWHYLAGPDSPAAGGGALCRSLWLGEVAKNYAGKARRRSQVSGPGAA